MKPRRNRRTLVLGSLLTAGASLALFLAVAWWGVDAARACDVRSNKSAVGLLCGVLAFGGILGGLLAGAVTLIIGGVLTSRRAGRSRWEDVLEEE